MQQQREKDRKSLSSAPARFPNLTTVLGAGSPQQVSESPIPTEVHNKSVTLFTVLVFCFWSA